MFKTITTLFRAQVAEAEEAIFDANAAFQAGKRDLAMVLAE